MPETNEVAAKGRRAFMKSAAVLGGSVFLAEYLGYDGNLYARQLASGRRAERIGLELYTVRDTILLPGKFEATLEKVASIGYKEVEIDSNFDGLEPKEFRAMLDRHGLSAPSTHWGVVDSPDLEKQFEGYQIMGIEYTSLRQPISPTGARPSGSSSGANDQLQTTENIIRRADQLNKVGKVAEKFGIKVLVHNSTVEFAPLSDNPRLKPYDLLLANTDPSVVAMQIDIGWATVAGQDIVGMFKKNPGRYVLWHVKDAIDLKFMTQDMTQAQRMQAAKLVPIGLGEIDYSTIFANADLAGMKHFYVEQDNASAWGDSLAASSVSFDSLVRMLSSRPNN